MALVTAATMLIIYGGLGFLGLQLAQKLGFAAPWDPKVSDRQRFLIPACVGVATGVFFIVADTLLKRWHSLALPHPPFPTSIVASATAGIGEEVIFRLFFIPFWTWLVSIVILRGRWSNQIFWGVAIFSALAFALGHLPSVMLVLGIDSVDQIPTALMGEIILLNGVVSLLAAYYFRRYGFLAAVGIHFWTDVVWHVVWGLLV
jgi:membrane protease YdiL (CAAX protease family)